MDKPLELNRQTGQLPTAVSDVGTVAPAVTPSPERARPDPDRHQMGNHGNGSATTAVTLVGEIPSVATLRTPEQFAGAARFLAGQHPAPLTGVTVQVGGLAVAVDGASGQISVASALGPHALVGGLQSGAIRIDAQTLAAGAADAQLDPIAAVGSIMQVAQAADAVFATEIGNVRIDERNFVIVAHAVELGMVHESVVNASAIEGLRQGEVPGVVESPLDLPATAPTGAQPAPAAPQPPLTSLPVLHLPNRGGRARPAPTGLVGTLTSFLSQNIDHQPQPAAGPQAASRPGPTSAARQRFEMGVGRLQQLMAMTHDFSRGDRARAQLFREAIAVALDGGIRPDDQRYAEVARYLQAMVQRYPNLVGNVIQVAQGVVRIDSGRLGAATLVQHLNPQSAVSILAKAGHRVAQGQPAQMVQMADVFQQAFSPQGVCLTDPTTGPLARQLATRLMASRDAQQYVTIQGDRMFLRVDPTESALIQDYFDFYRTDDHSAAAMRIARTHHQSMQQMTTVIESQERAIVFLTLYNHHQNAQCGSPTTPPAETPQDGEPPVILDADPEHAPAPATPPERPTERRQAVAAEPIHHDTQRQAAALNQYRLLQAEGERFLDALRAGTEQNEEQRLQDIVQHLQSQQRQYQQALREIRTEHHDLRHAQETVGSVPSGPGQAAIAIDRENRLRYDQPVTGGQ